MHFYGGTNHPTEKCLENIRKYKGKFHAAGDTDRQQTERPPQECFRYGYVDHLIAKQPKPPKYNGEQRNTVRFNEMGNRAPQKESGGGDDDNYQKIYVSMARMSGNENSSRRYFGDSSQLNNWVLDSGATCHMKPQVLDFIPLSLEDMYKYIEVADGHCVPTNQKGQVQIRICDNNGDTFIAMLHNVLLAPDLCNRLFSIITLMN